MSKKKLTNEIYHLARSSHGGYSSAQWTSLGIPSSERKTKGWAKGLIGRYFDSKAIDEFKKTNRTSRKTFYNSS